ncbi:MAG: glycosyltransferase family 4 protein [Flavobacteriales bacterium]|nr:glycosyltransferase family 4 protein [Flavobacteriales bacterium]
MNKRPVHIVEVMADPNSITYFNLFAERSKNHPEIKLSFICLNDAEPPVLEDMKERGCDSYWVKFDASNRVRSWIGAYFQLKKLLKQLQPDVVHSHLFDDGVPTMMAAKSLGIRKRIHTKQSTTFNWFYAPKAVFLDRLINRKATHLIAVSTEARQFLIEKERADAGKIRLIHHGISFENLKKAGPEEVSEFKAKFQLEGKRVIGTVSRYIKWKGYIEFIEAASLISDKYPDVVFMGVGSGSQEDELRELIRKKGLEDRFILTGWIDKKHIPAVFQSLDIYLHAAFMEPFGFVIPEAMINKVPIVTTPTGSALDGLTHLESAYIAPYNNVEALAAGMEYFLVNNRPDMVEKAYHSALEKYSINNMWENHLKLYLEA